MPPLHIQSLILLNRLTHSLKQTIRLRLVNAHVVPYHEDDLADLLFFTFVRPRFVFCERDADVGVDFGGPGGFDGEPVEERVELGFGDLGVHGVGDGGEADLDGGSGGAWCVLG